MNVVSAGHKVLDKFGLDDGTRRVKVITLHPDGDVKTCTKFHVNPSIIFEDFTQNLNCQLTGNHECRDKIVSHQ